MQLVDAHAHLSDSSFNADLDAVVLKARENGLAAIVDCGLGPEGGLRSLSISERFRGYVYSTIGIDYGAPFSVRHEEVVQLILNNRSRIV